MIRCDCHPFKTTQLIEAATGDRHFKEIPSIVDYVSQQVKVTVTTCTSLDDEGIAGRDSHDQHIH